MEKAVGGTTAQEHDGFSCTVEEQVVLRIHFKTFLT